MSTLPEMIILYTWKFEKEKKKQITWDKVQRTKESHMP